MASTCLTCQAAGSTVTFDEAEDYQKHLEEKHGPKPERTSTPRTNARRSPRSPRQPKRKK